MAHVTTFTCRKCRQRLADMDRHALEMLTMNLLLKREADGLNGRIWNAHQHLFFEELVEAELRRTRGVTVFSAERAIINGIDRTSEAKAAAFPLLPVKFWNVFLHYRNGSVREEIVEAETGIDAAQSLIDKMSAFERMERFTGRYSFKLAPGSKPSVPPTPPAPSDPSSEPPASPP